MIPGVSSGEAVTRFRLQRVKAGYADIVQFTDLFACNPGWIANSELTIDDFEPMRDYMTGDMQRHFYESVQKSLTLEEDTDEWSGHITNVPIRASP